MKSLMSASQLKEIEGATIVTQDLSEIARAKIESMKSDSGMSLQKDKKHVGGGEGRQGLGQGNDEEGEAQSDDDDGQGSGSLNEEEL